MFLARTRQLVRLLFLGLAPLMGTAQESALPHSPFPMPPANDELRSLMLEASKTNGLMGLDWPWHLKVSFMILDDQGKIKDQGTYEEYWVSPTKFRQSYTSASFSQTDYGTDKGVLRSGENKWPPYLLQQMRKAFVDPMPSADELDNARFTSEKYAGMICIRKPNMVIPPATNAGISTYCLMTDSNGISQTLTGIDNGSLFPLFRATRTKSATIAGHIFPYDLQVGVNMTMRSALTAHLESIEVIAKPNEVQFAPPKDAKAPPDISMVDPGLVSLTASTMVGQPASQPALPPGTAISAGVSTGLLLTKVDPVYPPIAKAARVSGTVVLEAHIDKEGKIGTLRIVSGPPMLRQAALDAVKQWTYKPYSVNGQPVEINTTVNVVFQLPKSPV